MRSSRRSLARRSKSARCRINAKMLASPYTRTDMKPSVRLSLCLCPCWIMFLDQPALSQPATENYSASNSHRRLLEIEKRVVTICQDLTQIRKSLDISDPDKEFVVDLWIACQTTADYVSNAVAVLW